MTHRHGCAPARYEAAHAREALDRMDTLGACWAAVGDLMNPEGDLHGVDRDNVATLLDFLACEYRQACEAFQAAISRDNNTDT